MVKSPTSPEPGTSRSARGISASDVDRVADELLRAGIRPTVLKIRERLGTGSPNTINPLLDEWWKRLASRLDSGPHALHRIPEAVAQITEALWLKALDSARERTRAEERTTRGQLDRDKRDVDLRRHVLSLREAEFEDQLKERARTIATLEEQVAALTRLLLREQTNRSSAERRIAVLEATLMSANARSQAQFSIHATPDSTMGGRKGRRRANDQAAATRKNKSARRKTPRISGNREPPRRKTSAPPAHRSPVSK